VDQAMDSSMVAGWSLELLLPVGALSLGAQLNTLNYNQTFF
jgi:hypothetical protein